MDNAKYNQAIRDILDSKKIQVQGSKVFVRKTFKSGAFLKELHPYKNGAVSTSFKIDGKWRQFRFLDLLYVHHIGPLPKGFCVRIDENNSVESLSLISYVELNSRSGMAGAKVRNSQVGNNAVFTLDQVVEFRRRYKDGESAMAIAKTINTSKTNVICAVLGRTYKQADKIEAPAQRRQRPPLTIDAIVSVRRDYKQDLKLTTLKLAEKYSIDKTTASLILKGMAPYNVGFELEAPVSATYLSDRKLNRFRVAKVAKPVVKSAKKPPGKVVIAKPVAPSFKKKASAFELWRLQNRGT